MSMERAGNESTIFPPGAGDEVTRETVALLLDEVSRLEAELQARATAAEDWSADQPGPDDSALRQQVAELTAELTGRDETIGVLLEQTRLFEEAATAQRDEWEQLTRWVEEVEQRVGDRTAGDPRQAEELAAQRLRSEDLVRRHEAERAAWDTHKRRLQQELAALHATPTGAPAEALESENHRLRAACAALERDAAAAAELVPLRARLDAADAERARLGAELRQERDDRAREKNESEATRAVLKTQLARASLQRSAEALTPGGAPPRNTALDADERIRALRLHLQELHEREAEQRAQRGLAARLSRLWKSTGPG
jgi:hypothetical protein